MSDADNAHDRETDEWIVPADLKRPPTASVSGSCEPVDAKPDHGPTLTADGFTEALRLTRDGGEDR